MKCYRKNGSDLEVSEVITGTYVPSMKCYRKNGSDTARVGLQPTREQPSMKCYRKNGSDDRPAPRSATASALNEVLPKER